MPAAEQTGYVFTPSEPIPACKATNCGSDPGPDLSGATCADGYYGEVGIYKSDDEAAGCSAEALAVTLSGCISNEKS